MRSISRGLLAIALLLALAAPAHATITLFGSASNPADNGTNTTTGVAITPPASMTAGMLVVVIGQARFAGVGWTEMDVTTTGGQKWHELINDTCGTTLLSCRVWATKFNGTWAANPVFETTAATSNTATMLVFQESDATKHFDLDVLPVFGTFVAGTTPFTKTITGITTLTNGAVAIAVWMSSDDNTWGNLTATWTSATAAAQVRNLGGSDQSMSAAYKVITSAGATGSVAQDQTALGGDAGGTLIMAFNTVAAAPTTAPTVDILGDFETSTNGTTLTAPILTSGTHGAGCTWTAASSPGAGNTVATAAQQSLSSTKALIQSGTTYDDAAATRGVSRDHTVDATDTGTFSCSFGSNKSVISWGFFANTSYGPGSLCGSAPGCDYTSMAMFDDGSGAFVAFNLNASFPTEIVARLECNANVPLMPHLTKSHSYWFTFKMDVTGGKCYGAVYDPSDSWNQVGFTVFTTIATTSAINRFQVLMTGGSFVATATGTTKYDNLAMDYTTALFPLLPGTAPGGGGGGSTCRRSLLGVGCEPTFILRGR